MHRPPLLLTCLALVLTNCLTSAVHAQRGPVPRVDTFANPLDVQAADPHVLFEDGVYYMYATSRAGVGFVVWTSRDLVRWQRRRLAFRKTEQSWGQRDFWAPCVIKDGSRYLMYYNAQPEWAGEDASAHRICVAEASSPLGPFTDIAAPMFDTGRMAIDAHVLIDNDGRGYLYYVIGSVMGVALDDTLTKIVGDPVLSLSPTQPWEENWTEGPYVLRHDDKYVMFYSSPGYNLPQYAVAYGIADSPLGPFVKPYGAPVLTQSQLVSGPGHNGITVSPDGTEMFIVYHTHQQPSAGDPRQIAVDRMRFVDDPVFGFRIEIDGPTTLAQKLPSGAPAPSPAITDEFDRPRLDRSRWTIVSEDGSTWKLRNGKLVITTQPGNVWGEKYDLRNLFLQPTRPGDFEIITKTDFKVRQGYDQVSLVVWQDHNNYIRLSNVYAGGRRWQAVRELGGKPVLNEIPNTIGDDVWMKITRRGRTYSCEVSVDGETWWLIGPPLAADFTEVQVGLWAGSPGNGRRADAEFEFFRVGVPAPLATPTLGTPSVPNVPPR
ncbi:MAG: family 43 glycosylhydrolase [Planctomycetota bacterium]|nr:family 43 glycosylhydrolase [Planctomycetota bacterium]